MPCKMLIRLSPSAQNDNLPIHEDKQRGVYVKNLSDFYVGSAEEVYEIMRQGGSARVVTSTSTSQTMVFPAQHANIRAAQT